MTDGFDIDVFERSPFDEPTAPLDVTPPRPSPPGGVVVMRPTVHESVGEALGQPIELPHALIYPSQKDGTGNGHVVIVQANGELTCICWPALRQQPRGCHAMVAARKLLGHPPV